MLQLPSITGGACKPVAAALQCRRSASAPHVSRTGRRLAQQGGRCLHAARSVQAQAQMKALIFDCDGVILESEELHRIAYNAAFEHFDMKIGGERVEWTETYYDMLQNQVGGGKPKMRWHFTRNAWPTSTVAEAAATNADEEALLLDTVQDWKQQKFQDLIASGSVRTRPGVLRLMDDARRAGLLVAVCSAATKESCTFTVKTLLGTDRFDKLDLFMAGNDVSEKKPDPMIYRVASERLKLDPLECLVIEDSTIGLAAAKGAGMRCMITYTSSTVDQPFPGAERIVKELGDDPAEILIEDLMKGNIIQDDRVELPGSVLN